ncbi:MAG: TrmH family RNA methyltransferase [Planctomycetia bacterium]|nr:TrmH family RNA methyltransferase [Planctomycetia bacterium]
MTDITSIANPRIKQAVKLRDSRDRRKSGMFPVDGIREILRARESGFRIEEVFVLADQDAQGHKRFAGCVTFERCYRERTASFSASWVAQGMIPKSGLDFLELLDDSKIRVWTVSPSVYEKLSFGDRDEGMIAIFHSKNYTLSELEKHLPVYPLIGVIEGVEKPGNVGAVFRSADGAGLDAMILACPGTDLFNPNIIRSSLGTVFRIPSVVASTDEVIAWLGKKKIQTVAAICTNASDYTQVDYSLPTAIVLGSEAEGLSDAWLAKENFSAEYRAVKIPMLGIADSLNISAAAAIEFYEARRQRNS